MVPEAKFITAEYVTSQQQRFNVAAQQFGETYARGQNMLFMGRDLLSRVAGRRTHSDEMRQAITNLQETRLNLTEVRARRVAQAAPNDLIYQQELATHFTQQYYAIGEEALTAAQIKNSNLGIVDDVYRISTRPEGTALRLIVGGALFLTTSTAMNLIQGENAVTAREIATFLLTSGGLNFARQIFLGSFSRSRVNLSFASTASLIRHQASIHEGQITGDEVETVQPINAILEPRLREAVLSQLQLDGITRPNYANPADLTDILRQRDSLRARIPGYEDLPALERSRNIARFSRLTRTLIVAGVAAFLISGHITRPAYCGSRTFPLPDTIMQNATDGALDISSWRGIAENEWFKRIYGRDFNPANPQDRIKFDKAYQYDVVGNNELIEAIVARLKEKNPQIKSAGRDFIKQGELRDICEDELDTIYSSTGTR